LNRQMIDPLENIVRAWARAGHAPLSAPSKPSGLCLDFARAERFARGEEPLPAELAEHIRTCEYCKKLVSDFSEALAEGSPSLLAPAVSKSRRPGMLRTAALAIAAMVLLAAGITIFFSTRHKPESPLLASAAIGLQSEIEQDLTPKGKPSFATGDMIMLRIELSRDCWVTLLNLDPGGRLIPMLPDRASSELVIRFKRGKHLFGPYLADNVVGEETIFIVTMKSKPTKISDRIAALKENYMRTGDRKVVIEGLRSWSAEVKEISFDHLSDK
jgi:hypothetical protein